jgi:hypothetical protein
MVSSQNPRACSGAGLIETHAILRDAADRFKKDESRKDVPDSKSE